MNVLIDTHVFLWWINEDKKLTKKIENVISNPLNNVFFSSASAWEMNIKKSLGKLKTPDNLEEALKENDFIPLSIKLSHAIHVEKLPDIHRDPFDRMLIAQAEVENLILITGDKNIAKYEVKKLLV